MESADPTGMDACIRKPLVVTCGMDKSVRALSSAAQRAFIAQTVHLHPNVACKCLMQSYLVSGSYVHPQTPKPVEFSFFTQLRKTHPLRKPSSPSFFSSFFLFFLLSIPRLPRRFYTPRSLFHAQYDWTVPLFL